jgi:superoxide reductase
MVEDKGVPVMCCGKKMSELVPGSVDASQEKHVPVFTVSGNKVYVIVGEVEHPMVDEHYIEWISIQTKQGNQRKCLTPADKPAACFSICDGDEVEAVYAYCNLHGLWMAENVVAPVCDLKSLDTDTRENYVICKCNQVKYFDIIDAVHGAKNIDNLLSMFENVKNTTHCSAGCGGCYNKVIAVISETMSGKL